MGMEPFNKAAQIQVSIQNKEKTHLKKRGVRITILAGKLCKWLNSSTRDWLLNEKVLQNQTINDVLHKFVHMF